MVKVAQGSKFGKTLRPQTSETVVDARASSRTQARSHERPSSSPSLPHVGVCDTGQSRFDKGDEGSTAHRAFEATSPPCIVPNASVIGSVLLRDRGIPASHSRPPTTVVVAVTSTCRFYPVCDNLDSCAPAAHELLTRTARRTTWCDSVGAAAQAT
ncbi:hypothetical protein PLICRDRAFT_39711 [Plicaturopsis crispa FD-325 SS-3]|nr:hypothetical protein PLICRDRAFT_39711 [Plicaturopsis crispa FD-325 SS-3]